MLAPFARFSNERREIRKLAMPIDLAFFFYHSPQRKMVTMYPSPAGATESLLPLTRMGNLVRRNSALRRWRPDVEALLINRVRQQRAEYILVPIDKCFELVGTHSDALARFIRRQEVWREIDEFFRAAKGDDEVHPDLVMTMRTWQRRRLRTGASDSSHSRFYRSPMPDLNFNILGVEPVDRGLVPMLHFKLEITNAPHRRRVQSVMLQTQIQIQSPQRAYSRGKKKNLRELFGAPDQWGQTLRNRIWTHAQHHRGAPSPQEPRAVLPVPALSISTSPRRNIFTRWKNGEVPFLFLI